jgi:ABC-type uncharacterized transport system substrate-binding protein
MTLRTLLCAAALVATPLLAGDFDALARTLRQTWPQCGTVAVVCDSAGSKPAVEALTAAFAGLKVIVVDVKGPQDIGKAVATLTGRHPGAVVLLPSDKVAGEGSSAASFLIQRLAAAKIPTVGTSDQSVKQGAVFAVGSATGGKVLGNVKAAGVVGVSLPAGATPV